MKTKGKTTSFAFGKTEALKRYKPKEPIQGRNMTQAHRAIGKKLGNGKTRMIQRLRSRIAFTGNRKEA